ncbi:MAG: hypothetical protein ACE5G1_06590 [bacterium]
MATPLGFCPHRWSNPAKPNNRAYDAIKVVDSTLMVLPAGIATGDNAGQGGIGVKIILPGKSTALYGTYAKTLLK